MCKTLNGGEWTTLNFTELNHHPGMEMFFVNRLSSIDEIFDDRTILPNAPSTGVPANIHGTHPFLIKIQQSIGGFDMLIYAMFFEYLHHIHYDVSTRRKWCSFLFVALPCSLPK